MPSIFEPEPIRRPVEMPAEPLDRVNVRSLRARRQVTQAHIVDNTSTQRAYRCRGVSHGNQQSKLSSAANTARIAGRKRSVAALGDSIAANNYLFTSTSTVYGVNKSSRGYITFAEILSKRAWY